MSSSRRLAWQLALCALMCAACAHTTGTQRSVILAGSVCSETPPLTAAASSAGSSGSPSATSRGLIAYFTPAPARKLVVYDIGAGKVRFEVLVALRTRPELLDDVVVAVDDQQHVVAYDLQSGQLRLRYPLPRATWLGAAQVGDRLVFTSTTHSFRPEERGSTVTALDTRSGGRVWERDVPYAFSRPRPREGRVLVVSDRADLLALDPETGRSTGCARLGSDPIEWLSTSEDMLLVGTDSARAVQLNEHGAKPTEGRLALPIADLPGQPMLQPSVYQSVPAERSAHGRVGVVAKLTTPGQAPVLAGAHYYFAFYKHLFAYDPEGRLSWVQGLASDIVQMQAHNDALIVVSESGSVLWLRPQDGAPLAQMQLPDRLTSAQIEAASPPATGAAAAAPQLRMQLRALAQDNDARLLPSRRLAVSALAALPDPEATRDLLDVYTQPSAPEELRTHVARGLAERHTGSQYLLDALAGDYDFLEGTPAPPLAAIVPGLVTNREVRAVPRLVDRLFDPDTRVSELNLLVQSIATLGGKDAYKPLAEFFALYHADSALDDDVASLLSAARALWTGAPRSELAAVDAAAKDPSTLAEVKAGLVPLLATASPGAPETPPQNTAEDSTTPAPALAAPERLSDSAIAGTFASHAAELRECVGAELARNAGLKALRFNLVIESNGAIARFGVWPKRDELVACLQPTLDALRFPAFARGRRLANYTLPLRDPPAPSSRDGAPRESAQPFWFVAQLRGVGAPSAAERTPWWHNQNPLYVSVEAAPKPQPEAARAQTPPTEAAAAGRAPDSAASAKPAAVSGSSPSEQPQAAPEQSTEQWWVPAGPQAH